MREDERIALVEPLEAELDAGTQIGRRVSRLGDVARLEPDRPRQSEEEPRVAEEAPAQAVALREGRVLALAPPPLERDHVQRRLALGRSALVDRMPGEELDRRPRPGLRSPGRPLGLGHLGLRPQHRVAVLEERVGVGDSVVRIREHSEDRLAAADMRELEVEIIDVEPGAGSDQLGRVVLVLAAFAGAAGEPEPVGSLLGRAQRREGEHVLEIDVLLGAHGLEDGATRELFRRVAEHRPMRDLARRRAAWADAVDDAAGPRGGEPVQVRRVGYLVRGAAAERVVRPVGEPVEEDDEDRIHGGGGYSRARNERRCGQTASRARSSPALR